jgi:hypothetical protein
MFSNSLFSEIHLLFSEFSSLLGVFRDGRASSQKLNRSYHRSLHWITPLTDNRSFVTAIMDIADIGQLFSMAAVDRVCLISTVATFSTVDQWDITNRNESVNHPNAKLALMQCSCPVYFVLRC